MNNEYEWPNNLRVFITGKDGFIGSHLADRFCGASIPNLDILDESGHYTPIHGIFHMAAITDTEFDDWPKLQDVNVEWPKMMWNFCVKYRITFVYASSAAVYGDGSNSFKEDETSLEVGKQRPLNAYGRSKQYFDEWALSQPKKNQPPHWYGLRFFNVYGPNEGHKGKMASQVYQTIKRAQEGLKPRFFEDGRQKRDFIYVEDCVNHVVHLWGSNAPSGIYNSGTGIARSFNSIGMAINMLFGRPIDDMEYFPMPQHLLGKYQSHTQAEVWKLRETAKYLQNPPYTSLEDGIVLTLKEMIASGSKQKA